MTALTVRDKLEILLRNKEFLKDLQRLEKLPRIYGKQPFGGHDDKTDEPFLSRLKVNERDALRSKIKSALGYSAVSEKGLRKKLDELKSTSCPYSSFIPPVSVIPYQATPGTFHSLREERFLTLEIDVTAASMDELLKEIGGTLRSIRPTLTKSTRRRKTHVSTAHIDPWEVFDKKTSGGKKYAIAKEAYRKKYNTTAGFSSNAPECKAVDRALKYVQDRIKSFPYPNR